jgi:hypothetical protein
MAKKNNEDEMLEDYEAEENDKPKKKKGGKKKKKVVKIVAWIVAFVIILAILLFIRFKYAATAEAPEETTEETAPADVVEEQYVPEPETSAAEEEGSAYEAPKHLGPSVVDKSELPNVQEVIDTSAPPELFSNLNCEYDETADILYISMRIYNMLDEDIKISPRGVQKGYNTYFLIRGVVDTDPGCSTELLPPGEYTDCKRIGFDLPRYSNQPGINRISVQVPGKTEALLFECPAVPEESAINQWINKAQ